MSGTTAHRTTRPETASRGLPATPLAATAKDALGRILAPAIAVCVSMWDPGHEGGREGVPPSITRLAVAQVCIMHPVYTYLHWGFRVHPAERVTIFRPCDMSQVAISLSGHAKGPSISPYPLPYTLTACNNS